MIQGDEESTTTDCISSETNGNNRFMIEQQIPIVIILKNKKKHQFPRSALSTIYYKTISLRNIHITLRPIVFWFFKLTISKINNTNNQNYFKIA